jgi:hypothetical protein
MIHAKKPLYHMKRAFPARNYLARLFTAARANLDDFSLCLYVKHSPIYLAWKKRTSCHLLPINPGPAEKATP